MLVLNKWLQIFYCNCRPEDDTIYVSVVELDIHWFWYPIIVLDLLLLWLITNIYLCAVKHIIMKPWDKFYGLVWKHIDNMNKIAVEAERRHFLSLYLRIMLQSFQTTKRDLRSDVRNSTKTLDVLGDANWLEIALETLNVK